jgi:hypothetical protein
MKTKKVNKGAKPKTKLQKKIVSEKDSLKILLKKGPHLPSYF